MCGRFTNSASQDELIRDFIADGGSYDDWQAQFSIAPTELVPIVRDRASRESGEIGRSVDAAVWNFHPSFMRESKRPQFNARIETVSSNGLWKGAFAGSRCLVPMDGYFEWTGEAGHKDAHYLHGASGLLAAAGICTARTLEDGRWQVSTAIITRPARDASGEVHDRMPVFLEREVWDEFLNPEKLDDTGKEAMIDLLTTESERVAATITSYRVDRRVNNSRAIDPHDATLIDPID